MDEVIIPGIKSLDAEGYRITSLVPILVNGGNEGARTEGMMVLAEPPSTSKG